MNAPLSFALATLARPAVWAACAASVLYHLIASFAGGVN